MVAPRDDAAQVRALVMRYLVEFGLDAAAPCHESVVVYDGHFIGRRWGFPGLRAIWFADQRQLGFYREDGQLLKGFPLDDKLRPAA